MYQPKVGEWVNTPDGVGRVYLIEERHDTLPVTYNEPVSVQFGLDRPVGRYAYMDVSPLSFLEFVFKGPRKYGFGLNSIWAAILIHVAGAFGVLSAAVGEDMELPYRIVLGVLSASIVGVLWLKTYHNYTRRTV